MTTIDVRIEKLVYGGDGLAHHEGQTVFVPFVLPGEEVAVQPMQRKKKFVRGRVERMLAPSPQRSIPPCPHFGVCGGCHYQHIPYAEQLRVKSDILRETLSRIGRIPWNGPIVKHPSPPFGYRSRAQWAVRPAIAGGSDIGYFQAASSTLCPVTECSILSSRLADTLAILRGALINGAIPVGISEIEASSDSADEKILLNVSFDKFPASPEELAQIFRGLLPFLESLLLLDRSREQFELIGPGYITYRVGENSYRAGHLSFFQVNQSLMEELVRAVAGETRGAFALDLFAGVGLFTIPLARQFERVVAVEANLAATRDLKMNLEGNSVAAESVQTDASAYVKHLRHKPDFVVLDPPRAGLPPEAVARLLELRPAQIAYLSCDPSTLARDLSAFTGQRAEQSAGTGSGIYEISEIHLFDLFPQTYHIESFVKLKLRE
ncbi:MAG TPA: class I SAM-dependent RNA methyltransferase [Candidatus Dormibacteraeota bacterium]|nr:class I SAM-dependent RNA methyltransferase [Candidatus Dormibacteraeota bacterium]